MTFLSGQGRQRVDHVTFFLHLDMETSVYVCLYVKDGRTGEVTARLEGGSSNVAGKIGYRKYWVKIDDISAHLLGEKHGVIVNVGGEFTVEVSALSYVQAVLVSDTHKSDPKAVNAVVSLMRALVYDEVYVGFGGRLTPSVAAKQACGEHPALPDEGHDDASNLVQRVHGGCVPLLWVQTLERHGNSPLSISLPFHQP